VQRATIRRAFTGREDGRKRLLCTRCTLNRGQSISRVEYYSGAGAASAKQREEARSVGDCMKLGQGACTQVKTYVTNGREVFGPCATERHLPRAAGEEEPRCGRRNRGTGRASAGGFYDVRKAAGRGITFARFLDWPISSNIRPECSNTRRDPASCFPQGSGKSDQRYRPRGANRGIRIRGCQQDGHGGWQRSGYLQKELELLERGNGGYPSYGLSPHVNSMCSDY